MLAASLKETSKGYEVIEGLSHAEYSTLSHYRSSDLKNILISPQHFIHFRKLPKAETPAMSKGTVLHAALLEPDSFNSKFAIVPKIDRRSQKGKAQWQAFIDANQGKTLLQSEDVDMVNSLRSAIRANDKARKLMELPAKAELSITWTDGITGLPLKIRPDRLLEPPSVINVDLKTTNDASKSAFRKTIDRFDYHLSMAMYRDGLKQIYNEKPPSIFFVVEERTKQVCLYAPDTEMLTVGYKRYRTAVETLARCLETNKWPGYQVDEDIETISLPPWADKEPRSATY